MTNKKIAVLIVALILILVEKIRANDQKEWNYIDVFSMQVDRREYWDIKNLGINLSRYFDTENLCETSICTGLGLSVKVGDKPKLELLPKVAFLGIIGGSVGGIYGSNGFGGESSLWLGLEVIGVEYSWYFDRIGFAEELSIYVSYQFGFKYNGPYRFENMFHSFWNAR